jgi:hypothetical protein
LFAAQASITALHPAVSDSVIERMATEEAPDAQEGERQQRDLQR